MNTDARDIHWMRKALEEAKLAMKEGELPIAAILVSDDVELARAQTQTGRRKSMAAHGELFALLDAGAKVFTAKHPLTIYTTLEPCLMCIGAAMQCQVDRIVYAMPAGPDGGSRFASSITAAGQKPPKIQGGILIKEAVLLMKKFVKENPNHFGVGYAKALLESINE
jgi:tRNA(adenine34) deaminase